MTSLETPFRLVAIVDYAQPPKTRLVMSGTLFVKPRWKLPAWLIALIGVVGGWLAGLLTPVIEDGVKKWFTLRNNRVGLLTYVARDVRPTLETIRVQLKPYLSPTSPDQMSVVTEAVYLDMAKDSSLVYRLVPTPERESYLGPFKALHDELLAFNKAVGQRQAAGATAAARRALTLLDRLLGVADRETPDEIAAKNEEKGT